MTNEALLLRGDADDAAVATPGGSHVEVACEVEGEALGASEMGEERGDDAVRIDLVHGVVGGGSGAADVEVSVGRKGQVIGGDAGFDGGKDKDLAVGRDFEDGAAAVADVEIAELVEGQPGGDAHAFGVGGQIARGREPIDGTVIARGDVEVSGCVEGEAGGIHDLGGDGAQGGFVIDAEERCGHRLAAAAGEGDVDVARLIHGGIGDGMEILREQTGQR